MDIQTYYQTYYERNKKWHYLGEWAKDTSRMLTITKMLRKHLNAGSRVLDIGCGDAYLSTMSPEFKWTGIDINLEKARSRGIALIEHDISKTPFPMLEAHFDAVVCSEVLEHLFDPEAIHAEAKRLLKSKGQYIISTPNHSWIMNIILAGDNLVYDPDKSHTIEHIRTYTPTAHQKLLHRAKFDVKEFVGADAHFCAVFAGPALEVQTLAKEKGVDLSLAEIHEAFGKGFPMHQHTIIVRSEKP